MINNSDIFNGSVRPVFVLFQHDLSAGDTSKWACLPLTLRTGLVVGEPWKERLANIGPLAGYGRTRDHASPGADL